MNENIQEKDVDSIVINYADGTQKVLDKGMIVNAEQEGEELNISMTMCHISGADLINYLESMVMAYMELTGVGKE